MWLLDGVVGSLSDFHYCGFSPRPGIEMILSTHAIVGAALASFLPATSTSVRGPLLRAAILRAAICTAAGRPPRAARINRLDVPSGTGARFKLVTNWRLRPDDPLVRLVLQRTHALDLDRLFDGTGPTSTLL
jgi:hypothetical protein